MSALDASSLGEWGKLARLRSYGLGPQRLVMVTHPPLPCDLGILGSVERLQRPTEAGRGDQDNLNHSSDLCKIAGT